MQNTKRKDENKEEKNIIILDYDVDLYSEYNGEINIKTSDKIPEFDEYEEEIKFVENYISIR